VQTIATASWSAAVLCRFDLRSQAGRFSLASFPLAIVFCLSNRFLVAAERRGHTLHDCRGTPILGNKNNQFIL